MSTFQGVLRMKKVLETAVMMIGFSVAIAACSSSKVPRFESAGTSGALSGTGGVGIGDTTGSYTSGTGSTAGIDTGGSSGIGGTDMGGMSGAGDGMDAGIIDGGVMGGVGGNIDTGGQSGSMVIPDSCAATTPLTGGTQHCGNGGGVVGSFSWSLYESGAGGCITPYGVGAAFNATWNNSGDFLARVGFQWDKTKTYDQLGTLTADYAYTKTGTGIGWSYIGIYGWSVNPLVEFYIVDDWFGSSSPPSPTYGGGAQTGSFDVDGATYKIFTHTQVNQPSIQGPATFQQFFSVRQTPRQCGHISITEHFKEWANLGMTLGMMYEAKILVEAGSGSGSIDYTSASMTAQ
jgi:endo-1,4-beta-xylanase